MSHRRLMIRVVLLTLLGLSLIFLSHYWTFIAPHYPVYADQPDYIWHIYNAYFTGLSAPTPISTTLHEILALANFKGWVFEALGMVAVILFGPSRLGLILANLALFCCLALTFASYFGRLFRPRVGLAALGLLLLSDSITMIAGGMEDLRWDFAGLVSFGLAFLALVRLLVRADRRSIALYAGAAFLTISTRSITGVYLGFTAAIAFLLLAGITLVARDGFRTGFWWARLKAVFMAGIVTGLVFLLQFLLFLPSILGYYGRILFSDEGKIRLDMAGISGQFGLLRYYIDQLDAHFRPLLLAAAAAILLTALFSLAIRRKPIPAADGEMSLGRLSLVALIAGISTLVGVLVPLSLWSPSPIVAGVLTGPLAGFGALAFGIADRLGREPAPAAAWLRRAAPPGRIVAALLFAFGVGHYARMTLNSGIGGAYLTYVRSVDDYQEQLVRDLQPTGGEIAWAAITDWAGLSVLDIYLYEHGLSDLVPRYDGGPMEIFSTTAEAVIKRFEPADAVLIYRSFNPPSQSAYPLLASLEQSRSAWQPVLDREFILRSEIALPNSQEVIGYYLRPIRVKSVTGAQVTFPNRRADFWMGEAPVLLHLTNMASDARTFLLTFKASPGPQAAEATRSTVRLTLGSTLVEASTDAAHGWQGSVRLTVPPGDSIITLVSGAKPAAAVPAGTATMVTHIGDLATTTHLPP